MVGFLGGLLCTGLLVARAAGADAGVGLDIIRRAFASDEANEKIARNYTFHERIGQKVFNKKGGTRRDESKTYDVTLLDGSEYRRLIARNDQPLSEKEAAKEEKKLQQSIRKMHNETPEQRRKRLAKVEKRRAEQRKFIREITRAYDFRLLGEETLDGIETYAIWAEPRLDYQPAFRRAKVLKKLRGKIWISKANYGWVQADIDTIEDFNWGLFLLKLSKGAKIRFTQQWVNDEVWLMDSWHVKVRARAGLLVNFNGAFDGAYSNFRKFSADSTVTFSGAVE